MMIKKQPSDAAPVKGTQQDCIYQMDCDETSTGS